VIGPTLFGDVDVPPIAIACAASLLATSVVSAVLNRSGFYRLVWHRPLVDVAVFCVLLAVTAIRIAP
jgi:hypothetical protein